MKCKYSCVTNVSAPNQSLKEVDNVVKCEYSCATINCSINSLDDPACLQHCYHNYECKDIHGNISFTFQIQEDSDNIQRIVNDIFSPQKFQSRAINAAFVGFQTDSKNMQ